MKVTRILVRNYPRRQRQQPLRSRVLLLISLPVQVLLLLIIITIINTCLLQVTTTAYFMQPKVGIFNNRLLLLKTTHRQYYKHYYYNSNNRFIRSYCSIATSLPLAFDKTTTTTTTTKALVTDISNNSNLLQNSAINNNNNTTTTKRRFTSVTEIDNMIHKDNNNETSSIGNRLSEYEKWVRRLYATNMFSPVKLGLDNIEKLHTELGNPTDDITIIHIAGSNGKGSVALKIARTLESCNNGNNKVGLFTSPHISCFRERMSINQQLISEQDVINILPKIYNICEIHDIPATFFEITTALAFMYYKQYECNVIVLETGLGGRLDATNIVKYPAISIITSISLEHTRILGNTIELIAIEKAGIIKSNCPVLVGPNVPHNTLRQCAIEKNASQYYTCDDILGPIKKQQQSIDNNDNNDDDDEFDYDKENTRIAIAALKILEKSHPDITNNGGNIPVEIIEKGTTQRPSCRFEHVTLKEHNNLSVILDVAHNPSAMEYLINKLSKTYPNSTFRMIIGMSSDKNLYECCTIILNNGNNIPSCNNIHFVEAAHPRAAKLDDILLAYNKAKNDIMNNNNNDNNKSNSNNNTVHYDLNDRSVTKQIHNALEIIMNNNNNNSNKEILVICGSVFLMAEAREALGFHEPRDSPIIAELAGSGIRHTQENFGNTK